MTYIITAYPDGRTEKREMTTEELEAREAERALWAERDAAEEAERAAAAAARESALAKLTALGLTEAEAAAIIK